MFRSDGGGATPSRTIGPWPASSIQPASIPTVPKLNMPTIADGISPARPEAIHWVTPQPAMMNARTHAAARGGGSAALKAGKYISENVYTEIEVDQEGKSRINLNLDLREGVTVKGRLGADGETGIGVYLEKDY